MLGNWKERERGKPITRGTDSITVMMSAPLEGLKVQARTDLSGENLSLGLLRDDTHHHHHHCR